MEAKILYSDRFSIREWCPATVWGRSLTLLLGVFALGAALGAAPVHAAGVYEVKNVAVDVTAETATAARDQALKQGERQAFRQLLESMVLQADHARLPKLADQEIAELIQDFSVSDEKTSAVRYLAKLTYRFREDDIRQLLRGAGIPFAETPSKPVLILPVLQQAGALLLWDDPNPWREAWRDEQSQQGLVPTLLPLGDLTDIGSIGPEQALRGDGQRLQAIAERYQAGATAVAYAQLKLDPAQARQVLEVTLTRHNITVDPQVSVLSFDAKPDEPVAALMTRAALSTEQTLEDNWKRDNLIQSGRRNAIAVSIPIAALGDWLAVKRRIGGVSVIRETEMVLLSKTEVQVILHYIGDIGQLILAMEQADLALQGEGDGWTVEVLAEAKKS